MIASPVITRIALGAILALSFGLWSLPARPAIVGAVFTVDSTGDGQDSDTIDGICDDGGGACTLRAAIEQANMTATGPDEIRFSIASGVQTIAPAFALPMVSDLVTIDGTTQSGYAGSPIIEVNGQNAGDTDGLQIAGLPAVVKGLVINRFAREGIHLINHSGSSIQGNFKGNTIAFGVGPGLPGAGVTVVDGSQNTIRGNSSHSNDSKGIYLLNGNMNLAAPAVASAGPVSGTACANCIIDVYSDQADEGELYHGSVSADGAGNWSFAGAIAGPRVTATATDPDGNTSEFSAPFDYCADADADFKCDDLDLDDDNDGVYDDAEAPCGGNALNASIRPERVDTPGDDDGDTQVNEPLPAGTEAYDCEGDGFTGSTEASIFSSSGNGDQDPCGSNGWPSDLDSAGASANKLDFADLGTFVAPVRRLGTGPGHDEFSERWDTVPGSVVGAAINVEDIAALVAGPSGYPPMFGGLRAYGNPCPYAP